MGTPSYSAAAGARACLAPPRREAEQVALTDGLTAHDHRLAQLELIEARMTFARDAICAQKAEGVLVPGRVLREKLSASALSAATVPERDVEH